MVRLGIELSITAYLDNFSCSNNVKIF